MPPLWTLTWWTKAMELSVSDEVRGPPTRQAKAGPAGGALRCPSDADIAAQSVGTLRHQSFELTVVSRAEVGCFDAVVVWEKRRPGCRFIPVDILVVLLFCDEGHAVTQNRLDLLSLFCIVSGHMQDGQRVSVDRCLK